MNYNQGKRPSIINVVARKKYDEWSKLKGMTKEKAEELFIAKLAELYPNWEQKPML